MENIEIGKKYQINFGNEPFHGSNLITMQYNFIPEIMKDKNSKLILNNNENSSNNNNNNESNNIAKVIIESNNSNNVDNNCDISSNIILKGLVSTTITNDYILIFSKEKELFELHDVKLSINGLKRDRENEFSDVRNSAETLSEIKAKMNKRLKIASSSSTSSSTSKSSKSQTHQNLNENTNIIEPQSNES